MPAQLVNLPPEEPDVPVGPQRPKAQLVQLPNDHDFGNSTTSQKQPESHFGLTPEHQWNPERLHDFLGVLPAIGGLLGGVPGAAAGAFARQAVAPNPSLKEGAEDTAMQGIIPELAGKVLGPAKDFLGKIASKIVSTNNPIVSKALGETAQSFTSPSTPALAIGQSLSEDVPGTVPPSPVRTIKGKGAVPLENPDAQTTVLDDYKAGKTPDQVAKKLVSDPREVQKLNLATGTPAVTEQLALNHAVSQGYNSVSKEFNPDSILKELGNNSEGYDAALQPGTKSRLTEFLNTAKSLQPTQSTGMLSYIKHRLVFDLGAFGIGHAVAGGGSLGMAVGGGSLLLTNQAVSKLMSSETLGNLALQSLKLAPDSPVSPLVAKTLIQGLRGTELFLSKDGKEQKVTVGEDGSFVPTK